ncbi:hypothetical protein PG989_009059 [Apiospora arundinis]
MKHPTTIAGSLPPIGQDRIRKLDERRNRAKRKRRHALRLRRRDKKLALLSLQEPHDEPLDEPLDEPFDDPDLLLYLEAGDDDEASLQNGE